MLKDFHNTQAENNSSSPEMNIFGYNWNGVEMVCDTTLCWAKGK